MGTRRVAGRLGILGGTLGVLAGVTQAVAGPYIPQWTGDKDAPVVLGLLTVLLSAVGVGCAAALLGQTPPSPGRRALAVSGLLVPAGICITTVGALWLVPGSLLLVAGIVALMGDPAGVWRAIAAAWSSLLISVLGSFEVVMGAGAGPVSTVAVGVIGGLALGMAPWVRPRRLRVALLLVGTLPFAVLTWWSVVGPLLALVAIGIGAAGGLGRDRPRAAPDADRRIPATHR